MLGLYHPFLQAKPRYNLIAYMPTPFFNHIDRFVVKCKYVSWAIRTRAIVLPCYERKLTTNPILGELYTSFMRAIYYENKICFITVGTRLVLRDKYRSVLSHIII